MIKRKLIAALLSTALVTTLLPTASFAAGPTVLSAESSISKEELHSDSVHLILQEPSLNGEIAPYGIKKWIAEAALKSAAWSLRHGGSLIDNVAEELGSKEARYFTRNTDVIADTLDDLAKESAIIEQRVIDQIAGALYDVGVPLSTARTIANVFTFLVL